MKFDKRILFIAHNIIDLKTTIENRHPECIIEHCRTSEEAFALLGGQSYDVIVSDTNFPKISVFEFYECLKTQIKDTPFIILIDSADPHLVIEAYESGIDFCLQKSTKVDFLSEMLYYQICKAVERKKSQTTILRECNSVFEHTGTASCIFDERSIIIKANRQFEVLSGYSKEEIEGKMKWTDFVDPNDLPRMADYHNRRLKENGEVPKRYSFKFLTRQGDIRIIDLTVDIIKGTSKRIASLSDATELKKSKDALKESDNRFQDLANHLPQTIFETDERGILTFVNEIAFDVFGYSQNDLKEGLTAIQMFARNEREKAKNDFSQVINKGIPIASDYSACRKDGSFFPITVFGQPIRKESRVVGIRGIMVDITEREEMEKRLRQQKEEIFLLIDILTHDLKNFHMSARGYIDLAIISSKSETQKIRLKKSRASIIRSINVLYSISILMRKDHVSSSDLQPIKVSSVVSEAIETIKEIFPIRDLEIRDKIEPECYILADSLFEQILLNLLTNAVLNDKHPKAIIDITCGSEKQMCTISVIDQGCGIHPDQRVEIFKRYGSLPFPGRTKGTGLGLYIVKSLVERYCGSVKIESRISEDYKLGTKFILLIPKP